MSPSEITVVVKQKVFLISGYNLSTFFYSVKREPGQISIWNHVVLKSFT